MGARMRARVTVHHQDGTQAADSGWGPWLLPTTNWGRILQAIFNPSPVTSVVNSANCTDRAGVGNALGIRGGTGFWGNTAGGSNTRTYCRVGWGNGAAAPARGDTDISGVQDTFNLSSQVNDETACTITVSGSKVSTVATNVTRVGLFLLAANNASDTSGVYLIDHATVSSTAVAVGQTVTVTYEVAY